MRTALPYEATGPLDIHAETPVVGTAPTTKSRNVHGSGFFRGLFTTGQKGIVLQPIAPVHAGPTTVTHPFAQPSTVAPNGIKAPIFVTFNNYSPVSHTGSRDLWTSVLPAHAEFPRTKLPGVNHSNRRADGAIFTTPYPMNYPAWPTSAQWLADQMREGQI